MHLWGIFNTVCTDFMHLSWNHSLFYFWIGFLSAVVVEQYVLSGQLLLLVSIPACASLPCTFSYLSHRAVIWLPLFPHIILVRNVHHAIEPTGFVAHSCVTLTNAWIAEWSLACPDCGMLFFFYSASEHITEADLAWFVPRNCCFV